jgi:hypothetical protein
VLLAAIVFGPAAAARADIGACQEVRPPRNDREALARAPFAFDGIVVGGRLMRGAGTGQTLLASPLVFRVTRWVTDPGWLESNVRKRYVTEISPGRLQITIWDAAYARGSLLRATERGHGPDEPLAGEILTTRGAAWRIYALAEGGVLWTSARCLGAHPITLRSEASPRGRASNAAWPWPTVAGAGILVVALGALLATSLSRERRGGERWYR